jgi:hypothetical protein
MDGTPTAGVSQRFARGDHTHPVDVSRYAANNPSGFVDTKGAAAAAPVQSVAGRAGAITLTHADITDWSATLAPYALSSSVPAASSTLPTMDGTAAIGTGTTWARSDHSHASDTSRYAASNPSGFQTAAQVTTIAHAGTATNDSAAAGQIGEFLSAQLLSTNAIALASGVDVVIASLPLTPGDYDVWGSVGFTMVSNNNTVLKAWLNAGGTTAPSIDQMGGNVMNTISNNTPQAIVPVPPMRVSTASAITVALGSSSTTGGGTINGWGKIMARRRR